MNINRASLFWGILLIGGGALALAQQIGYLKEVPQSMWVWVFVLISLLAVLNYALSGWQRWGWLFPAGLFGGLAVTGALALTHDDSPDVGAPLFIGLIIPFAAAYLTDRAHNWWALIPGSVMLFLAAATLLAGRAADPWIGSLFLLVVALSFLVVFLNNRSRRWALLVAYIVGVLSIAPAMSAGSATADYYGPVFLLAMALPFYLIYARSMTKWWAIIPAGVLTVLAVIAALALAGWIRDQNEGGYANALLLLGLAGTFSIVWLRHAKAWAKVVTIVLAIFALASLALTSYAEIFWPVAVILGGLYLLYTALRPQAA